MTSAEQRIPYDTGTFFLPAPVVSVTIRRPASPTEITVVGQIDTGSDITYLRREIVRELSLAKVGEVSTMGVTDPDGGSSYVSAKYGARVIIGNSFDTLVELAELPDNYLPDVPLLIGRDILNQQYLGLWGPIWEMTLFDDLPVTGQIS